MKIKNIFKKLTINQWKEVDLKDFNDFYLIGIKNKAHKKDILDSALIKKIKFEIAVETGVKDKYITISYINLNFDDISSSDAEFNKITSYARQLNGPSKFLIRAIEVMDTSNLTHKEGKIAVAVRLNPQNLG